MSRITQKLISVGLCALVGSPPPAQACRKLEVGSAIGGLVR